MTKLPNLIELALPIFVMAIVIEMFWAKRHAPEKVDPRDTLISLLFGLGSSLAGFLSAATVIGLSLWVYDYRLFTVPYTWWGWVSCFLLVDFAYYAFHRLVHQVRWFWASHVNHHSSQHFNLSNALRQSWTGFFTLGFMYSWPLVWVGFDLKMAFFCSGLNTIYQFGTHTQAIGRMPRWFEAVMNTPSHHRVHHAVNPRYLDRNFAGTFIIWDKLFGTFAAEADHDPVRYGIIKQLGSYNLLWVVFHEWIGIARDLWSAPWRAKLGYLFCPPGWSHDGTRVTSASIRAGWLERQEPLSRPTQAEPVETRWQPST